MSMTHSCNTTLVVDPQVLIHLGQDEESGGISDKPGNVADVFHTLFGVAGLSMLGFDGLQPVSPVYCMPQAVIDRLGLQPQMITAS